MPQSMQTLIKVFNFFKRGKTAHLITPELEYIQKNLPIKFLPNIEDIIYIGEKNYEVSRILHNFENNSHTILITIIPLKKKVPIFGNVTINNE